MSVRSTADRRLQQWIGGVAVLLMLATAGSWSLILFSQRRQTLQRTERRAANLALILSEYVREDFESVDRTLRDIGVVSREIGGSAAPTREWDRFLRPIRAGVPEVGSLTITDAQGTIRYSTIPQLVGQSRRDRFIFRRLAAGKGDVLVLDTPFRGLFGKHEMMLPLGRRLVGADGGFDGTVVATFLPAASRRFFATVDVGRDGMLWVFHPDGLVLFREPSAQNPIGESARGNPIFGAARARRDGVVRGPIARGGLLAISAFRTVPEPGLVVGVTLGEREALAEWRKQAWLSAVGLLLLATLLGAAFALLVRQIDARAAAEMALARAQRLEAIGQLTGGVAHDFNNLLTVVLGNASLLRLELVSGSDAARHGVEEIERAAHSGAELTQRLLAFARRQPLRVETLDLNVLVTRLAPMLRHFLSEDVTLQLRLAATPCVAAVDPVQLETMLANLCVNARDAMPRGGLLLVTTALMTLDSNYAAANPDALAGRFVELAVSDTGVGIPPEVQPHLFEPFFTTKEPGRGTGLGLSMVYGFVKQSGGHVKIYSEVGHGTAVKAYFPQVMGAGEAPEAEPVPERRAASPPATVLVVEDEPAVRVLTAEMLRSAGYRVLVAADGPSALAAAEAEPQLDLLLSDVMLPGGMLGPQLAAELRRKRPSLAVLLVSGYAADLLQYRGELDPAMAFLAKPYDRQGLLRAVWGAMTRGAVLTERPG
ncbi:MAG TPA: ATP-binding protein, partial [Thermoanaerobaculia bacterium]|jgi:signal transduction histidine kinase/ActR/RegA family two-component response regulator|nr:ATP-binding protein [Thermoanaerobaculia bacterium]